MPILDLSNINKISQALDVPYEIQIRLERLELHNIDNRRQLIIDLRGILRALHEKNELEDLTEEIIRLISILTPRRNSPCMLEQLSEEERHDLGIEDDVVALRNSQDGATYIITPIHNTTSSKSATSPPRVERVEVDPTTHKLRRSCK